MTLKEFFRRARRNGTWRVPLTQYVRCERDNCPLAAVTGYWVISDAARAAGLSYATARKIANAADSPRSRHRAWLLKQLRVRA